MKSKLIPKVNYNKFPILFQLDKKEINRILDNTFGEKNCKKCKRKIRQTDIMSVKQKQRGWCSNCWKRQYGRLFKPSRQRQFVEY